MLAGYMIDRSGFASLGWLAVATTAAAVLALWSVTRASLGVVIAEVYREEIIGPLTNIFCAAMLNRFTGALRWPLV
jgi:hypothetical protein